MVKDVSLTLITRITVAAAGIVASVITARALGVEGRGEYFYVMTLAVLATQFGHMGLVSSNTYSVAKDSSLLPRLFGNSLWVSILAGLGIATAIVLFEGGSLPQETKVHPVWLLIVMVPSMLYSLLASNLLVGLSRFHQYNLYQILSTLFQLVAIGTAAWFSTNVSIFLLVSAVTSLLSAVYLFRVLYAIEKPKWQFDWPLYRKNIGYAFRAYLALTLSFAVGRVAVLMLDYFGGKGAVGIYSIALQFTDALNLVPMTVGLVLFPTLMGDVPEGRFSQAVGAALRIVLVMLLLCMTIALIAPLIIPLLFGEGFTESIEVLWWMLPGVMGYSLFSIFSQYLAARGIPIAYVVIWIAGLGLLCITSYYLIPQSGGIGAAQSLSITYAFIAAAMIMLSVNQHRQSLKVII